jgi:hypothetical protein
MGLPVRLFVLLLTLLIGGVGVRAQEPHVVDPTAVDKALDEIAQETAAKRETVLTALRQPQVKQLAEKFGLDPARAEAAVISLDGVMLDQLAAQAQQVNDAIAGGQTVRLNLLWIIIGLLILILVIVAA